MTYKAVLFDLDGTLLDTLEDLGASMNRVLAAYDLPTHPLDAYRYFVGAGARTLVRLALPEDRRDPVTVDAFLAAFFEEYSRSWDDTSRPYEGIPELLDALVDRGLALTVLSNKPHAFTTQCVEQLLRDWHFEVVYGHRAGTPRKPDPTSALEVAERIGVAPDQILYLGDTGIDMETAVAAGCWPVGVLWGFRPAEELREHGARTLLAHPRELLSLLHASLEERVRRDG